MSGTADGAVSTPKGGGALRGLGEKFSADLQKGTGNFSVPFELPAGRNGFQPQLALAYSTGNPNGPFGLGWSLTVPGVRRKTSHGVPRYHDDADTFILSGAEDLVPVPGPPEGATQYRPRTEGLFARIFHYRTLGGDYWEVQSKDGLVSRYGTPRPEGAPEGWRDPAAVADPARPDRVFAWNLTSTTDPFGNRIAYDYEQDVVGDGPRRWSQAYLKQIRYVDYGDRDDPDFLISVNLVYEDRPDPFSDCRPGFEVRTRRRCARIEVATHADGPAPLRSYHLTYQDQADPALAPPNGASLLSGFQVEGHDGERSESLPPLRFGYTEFRPELRRYQPVAAPGDQLPERSLADGDYELVDVFGDGLPSVLELGDHPRLWRNRGTGRLDRPRPLAAMPAGVRLRDQRVLVTDVDGNGRPDLLVADGPRSGYFSFGRDGDWDPRFIRHAQAPTVELEDPEVRLLDLRGDGTLGALRTGDRFELFYAGRERGWEQVEVRRRGRPADFPDVSFSDPRVKLADLNGDGLSDIVLVTNGRVAYWPYFGHGRWGARVTMANSPRFHDPGYQFRYDPRRLLVGDVAGDGTADLVYVGSGLVTVWINQSGNGFTDPVTIRGTPSITDLDAVCLADLHGTGTTGILWTYDQGTQRESTYKFLDLTGGIKPYLLDEVDNRAGAITCIEYAPSTRFYLEDAVRPQTRWKTSLPFPVHVVARVESIDAISGGRLTSEYSYHHGHWDGVEREFRGFGRVDQRDTEFFDRSRQPSGHPLEALTQEVPAETFLPPTETRTWFHIGPVEGHPGEWRELDLSDEHWTGDPDLFARPAETQSLLNRLVPQERRDAVRSLQGRVLRSELYALDGDPEGGDRPYTVTEHLHGLATLPVGEPTTLGLEGSQSRVFFPHAVAERTTHWHRGDDPLTTATFTGRYDAYGQPSLSVRAGVPRGRDPRAGHGEAYLATVHETDRAKPPAGNRLLADRVIRTTEWELVDDGSVPVAGMLAALEAGWGERKVLGQSLHYYDGPAFEGLPYGQLGEWGALTRSEQLVMTPELLDKAYRSADDPEPTAGRSPYLDGSPTWPNEYPDGFRRRVPDRAGYALAIGEAGDPRIAGYFTQTERRRYDVDDGNFAHGRGLVTAQLNPLGAQARVAYDEFELLPTEVVDAVGLVQHAAYDRRTLRLAEARDPNGNRTRYAYTPLGLLEHIAVMGKEHEQVGDTDEQPGTVFSYDLSAFAERRQPISVRTIRRVHHATSTAPQPAHDETIEQVEYSDGFGRLVQTRAQAEDVLFGDPVRGDAGLPTDQAKAPLPAEGRRREAGDPENVVVSGWKVHDNKGRVVESYEPFFDRGWSYRSPTPAQRGQSTRTHYDPRGQVVRIVHPDDSEQRLVRGVPIDVADPERYRPTPWETYTYDHNDNAGRTHRAESAAYDDHWNTPSSVVVDALGRPVRATERVGPDPATEWYVTRTRYDLRGNVVSVTDPLGRRVVSAVYDLADRALRSDSLDAGVKRSIFDAAGQPIERRTAVGALALRSFDLLGRPVRIWARDRSGEPVTLRERIRYGDGGSPTQSAGVREAARAGNTLGRAVIHFDEAGRVSRSYDFKGNVRAERRRVIADEPILEVFSKAAPNWKVETFRVDWRPPPRTALAALTKTLLEPAAHTTSMAYDALNRVTALRYPRDATGARREFEVTYNRAGAPERLVLDGTAFVRRIAYNARGQRVLVVYGNGLMSRHAYDPATFRLARLRTERVEGTEKDELPYKGAGTPLQELGYRYDPAGNVLSIDDRAPGAGVERTAHGADRLLREFGYDALYRLTAASGRECTNIASPRSWGDAATCGFDGFDHGSVNQGNAPKLTHRYDERYDYDAAGNMLALSRQRTGVTGWTRRFGLGGMKPADWDAAWRSRLDPSVDWDGPPGNRLTHLGDSQTHFFDEAGYLVQQATSSHYEWDWAGRMHSFRTQVRASGSEPDADRWAEPSCFTHYLYNSAGQRVKKLRRDQGGQFETVTYIGANFEAHRFRDGRQGTALSVLDGNRRIASHRLGDAHPDDRSPPVKYQLDDHLGSSVLVVDHGGAWINREEYSPYGETTFGGFAKKRYRFAGKERDEESGLFYHGARYYAPWLARWTQPDPAGHIDGPNLYRFCRSNPLKLIDPSGRKSQKVNDVVPYAEKVSEVGSIGQNVQKDHVIAQGKQAIINPDIDRRNQMTVLQETGKATATAPAKPHTLATFHDPQADVKEITRLGELTPEDWARSSFKAEIVSPSLESRYRSGYSVDATNKAGLDELGSMFEVDQSNRAKDAPKQLRLDWTKASEAQVAKEQKSLAAAAEGAAKGAVDNPKSWGSRIGKFGTGALEVVAKKGGKLIPGVGTAVGLGLAASEAHAGNYAGALVEAAGASEIPIFAQVADVGSLAADIAWVAKDAFDPEQKMEQWWYETFLK